MSHTASSSVQVPLAENHEEDDPMMALLSGQNWDQYGPIFQLIGFNPPSQETVQLCRRYANLDPDFVPQLKSMNVFSPFDAMRTIGETFRVSNNTPAEKATPQVRSVLFLLWYRLRAMSNAWKLSLPAMEKMVEACSPSTRLSVIQAQKREYEVQLKRAKEQTDKAEMAFLACKETTKTLEFLCERVSVEEAKESASSWYSMAN